MHGFLYKCLILLQPSPTSPPFTAGREEVQSSPVTSMPAGPRFPQARSPARQQVRVSIKPGHQYTGRQEAPVRRKGRGSIKPSHQYAGRQEAPVRRQARSSHTPAGKKFHQGTGPFEAGRQARDVEGRIPSLLRNSLWLGLAL